MAYRPRGYSSSSRGNAPDGPEAIQWYGLGLSVTVQGLELSDGLVYVGSMVSRRSKKWQFTVDSALRVSFEQGSTESASHGTSAEQNKPQPNSQAGTPAPSLAEESPSYQELNVNERGAYLQWLAGGRKTPGVPLHFLNLFLTGLEYRLLFVGLTVKDLDSFIGGPGPRERGQLVAEMQRLDDLYGTKYPEFRERVQKALWLEWLIFRAGDAWPSGISANWVRWGGPGYYVLGQRAMSNKPLQAGHAMLWLALSRHRLPALAKECVADFSEIFERRFALQYPLGIRLKSTRKTVVLHYWAFPQEGRGREKEYITGVPDLGTQPEILKALELLFKECLNELKRLHGVQSIEKPLVEAEATSQEPSAATAPTAPIPPTTSPPTDPLALGLAALMSLPAEGIAETAEEVRAWDGDKEVLNKKGKAAQGAERGLRKEEALKRAEKRAEAKEARRIEEEGRKAAAEMKEEARRQAEVIRKAEVAKKLEARRKAEAEKKAEAREKAAAAQKWDKPDEPWPEPVTDSGTEPSAWAEGEAQWYGPGMAVTIQGLTLTKGMVYVGQELTGQFYGNDACLVAPQLPLAKGVYQKPLKLTAWPQYSLLSPGQRGAYLIWLSTDRDDPKVQADYLYLYVYGLERRILIDAIKNGIVSPEERDGLVHELRRLRQVYGQAHEALDKHLLLMLQTEWLLFRGGQPLPHDLHEDWPATMIAMAIALAQNAEAGRPMSAQLALRWLWVQHSEKIQNSVISKRCPEMFEQLFLARYKQAFGQGIDLSFAERGVEVSFDMLNPTYWANPALTLDKVPQVNAAGNEKLALLKPMLDDCLTDLKAYATRLNNSDADSLGTVGHLPLELRQRAPKLKKWREYVEARLEEENTKNPDRPDRNFVSVEINTLFSLVEEPEPVLTNSGQANLMRLVEGAGLGSAPNARFNGNILIAGGSLVLFVGPLGERHELSPGYHYAETVAKTLGWTFKTQEYALPRLQAWLQGYEGLSYTERQSLEAMALWIRQSKFTIANLRKGLLALDPAQVLALRQMLIEITLASGPPPIMLVRKLEVIYKTLHLAPEQVTTDMHQEKAMPGASKSQKPSGGPADTIDTVERIRTGFYLDMEHVEAKEADTRKVQGLLADIFDPNSMGEKVEKVDPTTPAAAPLENSQDLAKAVPEIVPEATTETLKGLDAAHSQLLLQLARQEEWAAEALPQLCQALSLMPSGAVEQLNEWGFQQGAESPLVEEEEDTLYVDVELIAEIRNTDNSHG